MHSAKFITVVAVIVAGPALARAPDASKIVGPGKCAECHSMETQAWKDTHHSKTFKRLPRRKAAKKIAKAMGYRRIKSGTICLSCHFTSEIRNGRKKPTAGITCESCHGAAKGWLKRHSEFSGKKKHTESKVQARKRWANSEAQGMIRPGNLRAVQRS